MGGERTKLIPPLPWCCRLRLRPAPHRTKLEEDDVARGVGAVAG